MGPVRRHAGHYPQQEFLVEALGLFPNALLGFGMLLGGSVGYWLGADASMFIMLIGLTACVYALSLWVARRRLRSDFEKGYIAERQIGQALDKAITAKGCAIAHGVTGVMKSGDIDHIVATPRGVWIIETKYRRVPKGKFPGVLSRLRACRAEVEALLPSGTSVRPCLVLAYERGKVKPKRDGGIRVYNNDTFRSEFLAELRAERLESTAVVDKRTSSTIWRLSRGEAGPEPTTEELQEAPVGGFPTDSASGRKKQPPKPVPNAGKPWTSKDDRELRRLHEEGWATSRLAKYFGRTPNAIKLRLEKLGSR